MRVVRGRVLVPAAAAAAVAVPARLLRCLLTPPLPLVAAAAAAAALIAGSALVAPSPGALEQRHCEKDTTTLPRLSSDGHPLVDDEK